MQPNKEINLTSKITRGEQNFNKITLSQPNVISLKGLMLMNVLQMESKTMSTLLSRISMPKLTEAEINFLPLADYTALCLGVLEFFSSEESEGKNQ